MPSVFCVRLDLLLLFVVSCQGQCYSPEEPTVATSLQLMYFSHCVKTEYFYTYYNEKLWKETMTLIVIKIFEFIG
jgi:hypothetical protein